MQRMRLTVLGSGSTVAHPRRSSAGFWVEAGEANIMLDCSGPAPHRAAQEGLSIAALDAVWISHFHMDHCGGIGPLLAGTKHTSEMKERTRPLRICGPEGTKDLVDGFSGVHNYRLLEQPFPIEIVEVRELDEFEIAPGVEAVAMSTPHTKESHAIHLRHRSGKRLVYSSDTAFSEPLAAMASGVDLFVLEATYVRDKPVKKHLELAEAIYLISKARPHRAMLTHFYPEWDEVDFAAEVRRFSPLCEVIEARDGLVVEV